MTKPGNRSRSESEAERTPIYFRNPVITACLVVIALCIGGYAFSYLKAVLSPLLVALFIFFLTNPIVRALQARNCSPTFAYFLVLTGTILSFLILGRVIFGSIQEVNQRLPDYQKNLARVVDRISTPVLQTLEMFGLEREDEPSGGGAEGAELRDNAPRAGEQLGDAIFGESSESLPAAPEASEDESPDGESVDSEPQPEVDRLVETLKLALAQIEKERQTPPKQVAKTERERLVLILSDLFKRGAGELLNHVIGTSLEYLEIALMTIFYLFFILVESHKLPQRIKRGFAYESTQTLLQMGHRIQGSIEQYLRVKTGVSLGLGATTGLLAALFGLDFWLLWAGVMFLANYVTYIGSMAALVPPIAIAFLQFDSLAAAAALSVLLIANRFVWIDYAEIKLSGQQLNVSPVILLLSIALFGTLWGVIGMVLAVPVVTSVKIALSQFESTEHLASLLSED